MVNTTSVRLNAMTTLLRVYLAVVTATLVVLALLSVLATREAPQDAWVHAVIVAGFAGLLLARARSARAGNAGALRAVGLIAAVLLLVNVVEALIPDFVPTWMRVEMIGIAVLMAAVIRCVARARG